MTGPAAERILAFLDACKADASPDATGYAIVLRLEGIPDVGIRALAVADLRAVLDELERLAEERDGHRARQIDAENALTLLLIREGGRTEFTPAEMTSAPSDGSFVSSRDAATGNEVLEFVAARRKVEPAPRDADCDCDCQPGQPCLCSERDCYCGPCPVCDRKEGDHG